MCAAVVDICRCSCCNHPPLIHFLNVERSILVQPDTAQLTLVLLVFVFACNHPSLLIFAVKSGVFWRRRQSVFVTNVNNCLIACWFDACHFLKNMLWKTSLAQPLAHCAHTVGPCEIDTAASALVLLIFFFVAFLIPFHRLLVKPGIVRCLFQQMIDPTSWCDHGQWQNFVI